MKGAVREKIVQIQGQNSMHYTQPETVVQLGKQLVGGLFYRAQVDARCG